MEPRFRGAKVILVRSFARIHETNLKKQGVLPLTFADPCVYDQIEEDDKLSFLGLAELAPGKPVYAEIVKPDGTKIPFEANHTMNDEQIDWFRAGGALNIIRRAGTVCQLMAADGRPRPRRCSPPSSGRGAEGARRQEGRPATSASRPTRPRASWQAKDAAAAEVKRLRGSDGAPPPSRRAAADAAYKAALAAVVAAETGEAPPGPRLRPPEAEPAGRRRTRRGRRRPRRGPAEPTTDAPPEDEAAATRAQPRPSLGR